MATDQRFEDRLKRINAGKQWAPDGVVHTPRSPRAARRRRVHHPGGLALGLFLTVPLLLVVIAPEQVPPITQAVTEFLDNPSADRMIASLGQIDLIAAIIDR